MKRKYHLILVDTKMSEDYDYIIERFKQRAGSPAEAAAMVSAQRLKDRDLEGLELRAAD